MRVVLDTSALVCAIRSERGAAAEIVRLAVLGKLVFLIDFKLICEYREVLSRPQHLEASGKTVLEMNAILDLLEALGASVVVLVKPRPLSPDRDDDMVLDVAINGGADVIVTQNLKDFSPAAARFNIRVLTPRDFLAAWKNEEIRDAD